MFSSEVKQVDGEAASIATSLLCRAASGDQDAWDTLFERYVPLVRERCRQRGVNDEDARDVSQEVFLFIARQLGRFNRSDDGPAFCGWGRRITEHKIQNHRRRSNRPKSTIGDDLLSGRLASSMIDAPAADTIIVKETLARVLDFVDGRINSVHWKMFWQIVVEELPAADVAEMYGLDLRNVYVIKSRILSQLRRRFAKQQSPASYDWMSRVRPADSFSETE